MAKKPSIAFLLSGKKEDAEPDEDSESSLPDDDGEGKDAAAQAVLDAVTAGDANALAEALDSFLDLR